MNGKVKEEITTLHLLNCPMILFFFLSCFFAVFGLRLSLLTYCKCSSRDLKAIFNVPFDGRVTSYKEPAMRGTV